VENVMTGSKNNKMAKCKIKKMVKQHAQKNMLKHIKHCGSFKSKNKTKGMQKGL